MYTYVYECYFFESIKLMRVSTAIEMYDVPVRSCQLYHLGEPYRLPTFFCRDWSLYSETGPSSALQGEKNDGCGASSA